MDKKQIISDLIKQLRQDFRQNGEVAILYMHRTLLNQYEKAQMRCSCVETDWYGSLCYNPDGDTYFFEGELSTDFGGNKTQFEVSEKEFSMIPSELLKDLRAVALTGVNKYYNFSEPNLLD